MCPSRPASSCPLAMPVSPLLQCICMLTIMLQPVSKQQLAKQLATYNACVGVSDCFPKSSHIGICMNTYIHIYILLITYRYKWIQAQVQLRMQPCNYKASQPAATNSNMSIKIIQASVCPIILSIRVTESIMHNASII